MNILELLLTAFSLGTDAFTISICKGLNTKRKRNAFLVAFYFGLFQTIMPILGYYIGSLFNENIINYSPYISTILLVTIGFLMLKNDDNSGISDSLKFQEMFILSVATSIDAFVIGISFSFLKTNILSSSIIIGIITFIMCLIGFLLGNYFNKKIGKYSNFIAGIILILIGIKILIVH